MVWTPDPGKTTALVTAVEILLHHAKAVVALARNLAEAAYWVPKKEEPYKELRGRSVSFFRQNRWSIIKPAV